MAQQTINIGTAANDGTGDPARRARVEIVRLQPELAARRQQASLRVIENLLQQL